MRDTRNTGGKFASKYRRLLTDRSPRCAVTSGTRQPRLSRYKSAKLDNACNFRAALSSSALKILHSAIRPPPARQTEKNKPERNREIISESTMKLQPSRLSLARCFEIPLNLAKKRKERKRKSNFT